MHLQEAQDRRPPSGAFSHRSVMAQRPAVTGDVGMRAPALLSPFEETPMSRRTIATPNSLLNSRKFRASTERPATRDLLTGDPYQSSPIPSHAGGSGTHTPGSNLQVRTSLIHPAYALASCQHLLPFLHAATQFAAHSSSQYQSVQRDEQTLDKWNGYLESRHWPAGPQLLPSNANEGLCSRSSNEHAYGKRIDRQID